MSKNRDPLHDLTVVLRHETEKAWLLDDGTTTAWVPKSWGELEENPDGKSHTLTMPESKCQEKGFI